MGLQMARLGVPLAAAGIQAREDFVVVLDVGLRRRVFSEKKEQILDDINIESRFTNYYTLVSPSHGQGSLDLLPPCHSVSSAKSFFRSLKMVMVISLLSLLQLGYAAAAVAATAKLALWIQTEAAPTTKAMSAPPPETSGRRRRNLKALGNSAAQI